jgi:hypothetical protein
MRFTIRDVLWLTALVAMGCALLIQNKQLNSLLLEKQLLRSRLVSAKYHAKELAELTLEDDGERVKASVLKGWPHTLADKWEQLPDGSRRKDWREGPFAEPQKASPDEN